MNILNTYAREKKSLLCLGLDLDIDRLPDSYLSSADPVLEFSKDLIDATIDSVVAYKPNFAFYEALGLDGHKTLAATIAHINSRALVIGDAKRADIGNTSFRYAKSAFDQLGCNIITLAPYMGRDSIEPFLSAELDNKMSISGLHPGMGAFVLALTSNSGADDFQMLKINGKPLYWHVLSKIDEWNKDWATGRLGAVVGATRPEMLAEIRAAFPELNLLIPGIGAQGGTVAATMQALMPLNNSAALINVSRGILYGQDKKSEIAAVAKRAADFNSELNGFNW